MNVIYFLVLVFNFSFSQIQYGGVPSYKLETTKIPFIMVDKLQLINKDLHPMVLRYANEYSVDVNFINSSIKIQGIGNSTYYLGIESSDAKAIAFMFDEFNLTKNTFFTSHSDKNINFLVQV